MEKSNMINGKISSIETMGTLDGPGIRFVCFLQGCNLRCLYCHNPETWASCKAQEYTPQELISQILKYKNYFGENGGVTFSGGEPLLQPDFLIECLKLCKQNNIHTCIDTAGVGIGKYDEILKLTDLILLDIKAIKPEEYKQITGQNIDEFYKFLKACIQNNSKLWIRQVIVPGINDDKEHILLLKEFIGTIQNVEKVELLPYRTLGKHKYKNLGIHYQLENKEDLPQEKIDYLYTFLK